MEINRVNFSKLEKTSRFVARTLSVCAFYARSSLTGGGIAFKGVGRSMCFADITYPVGETIVKAKQWAFGLRPIHLSRPCESGEAAEREKKWETA